MRPFTISTDLIKCLLWVFHEDKGTKENQMLTLGVSLCALATVLNFQLEMTFSYT